MQDQAPALLWREEGGRGGRNKVPPPPFPPPYVALVKAEGSPAPREGGRMGGGGGASVSQGTRTCPGVQGRVWDTAGGVSAWGGRHSVRPAAVTSGNGGGGGWAHLGFIPISVQGTSVQEPGCTPASPVKRTGACRSQRRDAATAKGDWGKERCTCAKSQTPALVLPSHGGGRGGEWGGGVSSTSPAPAIWSPSVSCAGEAGGRRTGSAAPAGSSPRGTWA